MTYRESAHYQEARRRAELMRRSRTPLGRFWHQKQLVHEIKALLAQKGGAK